MLNRSSTSVTKRYLCFLGFCSLHPCSKARLYFIPCVANQCMSYLQVCGSSLYYSSMSNTRS